MQELSLRLQGVTKNYVLDGKPFVALDSVSLEAKKGEFVAIVGPSGCGKSTLLRIAAGLEHASSGGVILEERASMLFQAPQLFPWLSVCKNIEFSLMLGEKTPTEDQAYFFVQQVGLEGFENAVVKNLSGGMKQRLSLAMVLANDSGIILMDEPFSSLDAQTREAMHELVLQIFEKNNKTCILVTHDVEEALLLADKVCVMSSKPGRISDCVKVNLPRPRNASLKLSDEFLALKRQVYSLLKEK